MKGENGNQTGITQKQLETGKLAIGTLATEKSVTEKRTSQELHSLTLVPDISGSPFIKNNGLFALRLLAWYRIHKRELPWRETTDPYRIWISEIILQQTRVVQGWNYFNKFIQRFPTVAALASAHEDEVMTCWQGLGYYSRARNLHAAAKQIMEQFNGAFPVCYEDVLSLKGIGAYTAAAICSFAYRAPYAVVDGNVYRVLSRIFGIPLPIDGKQAKVFFTTLASRLLDKASPDDYNQAIMDFGATQCLPQSPDCSCCPFNMECVALKENRIDSLPVKKGKPTVKPRYFNYFHIHYIPSQTNNLQTDTSGTETNNLQTDPFRTETNVLQTDTFDTGTSVLQTDPFRAGTNDLQTDTLSARTDTFKEESIQNEKAGHPTDPFLSDKKMNFTLLYKRTGKDIWQNLYEFPLIETEKPVSWEELTAKTEYRELVSGIESVRLLSRTPMPKHLLSHRIIHAVFYEMEWNNGNEEKQNRSEKEIFSKPTYLIIPENQLTSYPVSRLTELYLESHTLEK